MSDNQKINKLIQDLIYFFVKENYKHYLQDNNIKSINESKIPSLIDEIYIEKKLKLKSFLKNSLKEIMKDDYIGDLIFENICTDIFNDEELCKNRLIIEIKLYQETLLKNNINYDNILN